MIWPCELWKESTVQEHNDMVITDKQNKCSYTVTLHCAPTLVAFHGTRPMHGHRWKSQGLVLLLSPGDTYDIQGSSSCNCNVFHFLITPSFGFSTTSLCCRFSINPRCVTWYCTQSPVVARHVYVTLAFWPEKIEDLNGCCGDVMF